MDPKKKRVTFAQIATVHKIPYCDRRNFLLHDIQRFRERIRQAEVILKPILIKKANELSDTSHDDPPRPWYLERETSV